ncbi:yippee family protein [Moelleriella libera RCEF 2490]|uniref:Yippee family protein n=1 Tax=Moelleriella libera RCEF 2490 TaxID=1081109 RepID=A0A167YAJ2_9HYPO|nr:yippee family protein [Moelleriella libera RCEF 2490]
MARRRSTSTIISATRPVFPSYLLPSWNFLLPRRVRRRSSSRSSSSTSDESVSAITAATATSPGGTSSTSTSTSITSSRGASTVPTTPPSPSSSTSSSSSTTGSPSHQDTALQKPIAITPHRHHHHRQKPRVVLSRSGPDALRCVTCSTHLALTSQIVSKGFTGRNGRAYLVEPPSPGPPPSPQSATSSFSYPTSLLQQRQQQQQQQRILHNIRVGRNEDRHLSTGWHVVADICCATCSKKVGWKYVDAKEESQKYKIGKFILETDRVMTHRSWEDFAVATDDDLGHFLDDDTDAAAVDLRRGYGAGSGTDEVVFDSGDDDECDELFAGTWNAAAVAKRRSESVARRISHSLPG